MIYKVAFDPAGGARGGDGFAVGIGHSEGALLILDCLYERMGPFNPSAVIKDEISPLVRSYGASSGVGDRYASQFTIEAFAAAGIEYVVSRRDRSQAYLDFLPLMTAGRVRLLDNPKLISQLAGLERITNSSGRDKIDHMRGQHDDLANVAALCLVLCAERDTSADEIIPIFVADEVSHGRFDRWAPNYSGGVPMPMPGSGYDYAKDEYIGTLAWDREQRAKRGNS
jgi:hypothetical protein